MNPLTQVPTDPQSEAELGRAAVLILRALTTEIAASPVAFAFVRTHRLAFDAYRRAQIIVQRAHAIDLQNGHVKLDPLGWCEECGQVHELAQPKGGAS